MSNDLKQGADLASLGVLVGWMMDWLPAVATVLTVAWTGLRVWEAWIDIQIKRKNLKDE